MITTICYNKPQHWKNRKEAIQFFTEAVYATEGSEKERYNKILTELLTGKTICKDYDE